MAERLSDGLVGRLREKAGSPAERSDASNLEANSPSAEEALGAVPKSSDPAVREYLDGMNSPLAGMVSNMVTGDGSQATGVLGLLGSLLGGNQMFAMGAGGTVAMGPKKASVAPPPCTEDALVAAEGELGFALPGDLRHFYAAVADGGVGPGNGLYSLRELLAKWREMTAEPVGPRGQKWPANLLPIHGDRWDLTCVDRDSGALVYFDAEEIEYGGWKKAFKREADSLEAWLGQWAGGRSAHQTVQDEIADAKSRWAEEWIAKLEGKSEAYRASHGFRGDDWRDQVRQRMGVPPRAA